MVTRADIKIAVFGNMRIASPDYSEMGWIRWQRIGEAFARLGYSVDLILDDIYFRGCEHIEWYSHNFRKRSAYKIKWSDYDVIKILFPVGFELFKEMGGLPHPFIITKLGSVVASKDQEGIYFFNNVRKRLFQLQKEIVENSRYVVSLTDANENCLKKEHPKFNNYLRVPTGTEKIIPPPIHNPYLDKQNKVCIYAGHIYYKKDQPELNERWQIKLNFIGRNLLKKGIRLYFIGTGELHLLDSSCVSVMGPRLGCDFWDCQYFADVGIALSDGPLCDNESSKIYYYLRAGLPVVAEESLPNAKLVQEVNYGKTVRYDDIAALCKAVECLIKKGKSDKEKVMKFMSEHHSWDERVLIYDSLLKKHFNISG